MARLLRSDRENVRADPLRAARDAAETFGGVAVIKGEWSFIVAPDGESFRFKGGGIGLATSGSGDALAGIVGGLAARGSGPLTAALWGVYLHGEAGRLLAGEIGRIGFLAREILDQVPGLMESE
jgi:NAD(P)H-hydrate repair Nnr-like enzyme with NAD(P)H-hydrate dehydratase domain